MNRADSIIPLPTSRTFDAESRQLVREQVAADLSDHFATFVTLSAAYRAFERETGISKRQAERYQNKESAPQFLNLIKIYSFITGIKDLSQLIDVVPPVIAKELKEKNTNSNLPAAIQTRVDFSEQIAKCRAFSFIYWNTVSGLSLSLREVERKFGEYGTQTLQRMEKQHIVVSHQKGFYSSGKNRSQPINAQAAAVASCDLIANHFSPDRSIEEGNNFLGMQVFTLNKESREIALFKLEKLHRDLATLAANSSGEEEPFFVVLCADKMNHSTTKAKGMDH